MAYTIRIETGEQYTWHVQANKPCKKQNEYHIQNLNIPFENVIYFHADGHELQNIIQMFPNVPITYSSCMWRGELAQFIYDNL